MPRSLWNLCALAVIALVGCQEVRARHEIQEGNKAYYQGDYDLAIKHYEKGLQGAPKLAIGWYNLGLAHVAMFTPGMKTPDNEAHAQGAIKAFQKYLELEPNDVQARDYLLSTYIDSGHYEGALDYFKKRLDANPNDLEAIGQLAQINTQAGQFDEAVRWHKKKAEIEKSTDGRADAWYSIGVLEWRRLNKHPEVVGEERAKIADEGISALAEADAIRPNHANTQSYWNLLYRERALAHEASWARAIETASAQIYYKRFAELQKAAQAAQAGTPGGPGGKPAPSPTAPK